MSKRTKVLDLTNNEELQIVIPSNIRPEAQIIIKLKGTDENNVDVITAKSHTLTIGGNTYTVGSGLSIVGGELLWTFTKATFTTERVSGKLEADSNLFGEYYLLKISVWVR